MKKLFKLTGNQSGFTMIELLIVIVILAILVVIGIGNFMSSQIKSRDSARKTDLQNIARALELYYNDKGQYPIHTGKTGILGQEWGGPFVDPENPQTLYMNLLPSDPGAYTYYYTSVTGGQYQLYAYIENENDRNLSKSGEDIQVYTGTDCGVNGIKTCNYGISSSNTDPESGHVLTVE